MPNRSDIPTSSCTASCCTAISVATLSSLSASLLPPLLLVSQFDGPMLDTTSMNCRRRSADANASLHSALLCSRSDAKASAARRVGNLTLPSSVANNPSKKERQATGTESVQVAAPPPPPPPPAGARPRPRSSDQPLSLLRVPPLPEFASLLTPFINAAVASSDAKRSRSDGEPASSTARRRWRSRSLRAATRASTSVAAGSAVAAAVTSTSTSTCTGSWFSSDDGPRLDRYLRRLLTA